MYTEQFLELVVILMKYAGKPDKSEIYSYCWDCFNRLTEFISHVGDFRLALYKKWKLPELKSCLYIVFFFV